MSDPFVEVTIVIVIAAILGIVAKAIRQPTVVAYLFAGILVAGVGIIGDDGATVLDTLATFGVTLLLFLVGLEMRVSNLKSVGRAAVLTGLGQIIFTATIGFVLVRLLGYAILPSLYIAFALTFSSTIIVIKLLSQKGELQTLYGRIVVGFLIVQDIVAILILLFLGSLHVDGAAIPILAFGSVLFKGVLLFTLTVWLSRKFFPWLFGKLARTPELVFITSIAWAFGFSLFAASDIIGLSVEIGGFLAGLALARSIEQFQIESQLRPLRDFFILIFFIVLGSSLIINELQASLWPALLLSLFVLIGNPLIILLIMGLLRFRKKTSFYASVTVAQISEFGLILMAMGLTLGHITSSHVSLVTMVAVITITISTYFILHSQAIYKKIKPLLNIFERGNAQEESLPQSELKSPIVLAGANRLGKYILKSAPKEVISIVEFDPEIAQRLKREKYRVVFGDITDTDIQDLVYLSEANVFISTIPTFDDNMHLLERIEKIKEQHQKAPIAIVTAYSNWEAKQLYNKGADYVILPHFLGGKHLAALMKNNTINAKLMEQWRNQDVQSLIE